MKESAKHPGRRQTGEEVVNLGDERLIERDKMRKISWQAVLMGFLFIFCLGSFLNASSFTDTDNLPALLIGISIYTVLGRPVGLIDRGAVRLFGWGTLLFLLALVIEVAVTLLAAEGGEGRVYDVFSLLLILCVAAATLLPAWLLATASYPLPRSGGITLSLLLAYGFYGNTSSLIDGPLPWYAHLSPAVGPLLCVLFALSLFAGHRVYAVGHGRLTTFVRFALGISLLAEAVLLFSANSSENGRYLFDALPSLAVFNWIAFVAIPLWLLIVARGKR